MFTGIIEELGRIRALTPRGRSGIRIVIEAADVLDDVALGASIAVNGCCLTVVDHGDDWWAADAVPETMRRTALGRLGPDDPVNLERPVRVNGRLGGHVVQGHVDGTSTLLATDPHDDGSQRMRFDLPPASARYVCEKGSIAVDGISLTVASVSADSFSIAVIPHTLAVTTLGSIRPGAPVNLELDIVAKYVERQAQAALATGGVA
ncbi:MAG: riboflavin synthase [Actinomycetota bacterium]